MKLKRAILFGALTWIIVFFEISILMFGFNLQTPAINYIHYILIILILGFISYLYFKPNQIKKGFAEGLLVGLVFAITGILLDAIITIPLFVKTYIFFADPYLWIGIVEGILITAIVGAIKK